MRQSGLGTTWRLAAAAVARAAREFFDDGCPHLAASIAFRVLFSLFPLAIVLGAVFGIVSEAAGFRPDAIDAIVRNAPLDDDGRRTLRTALQEAADNSSVGLLGVVGLVWAASGMMTAVRTALNLAWEVEDRRPWLLGKAVDVLFVFGTALVISMSVALNLTIRLAQELVADLGVSFGAAVSLLGLVAPFTLAALVTIVVYRFATAASPRLSELAIPALLVATVFTAAQIAFAWYLESFDRYNAVYGSLGAVVAFMFFVYLASLVFLFGAELAAAIPRARRDLEAGTAEDDGEPLRVRLARLLRSLVVRDGRDDRRDGA